jgi:hypothetical protein
MATQAFNNLTSYVSKNVGSLVSMNKYIKDLANGAIFTEEVENFTLVELGFNTDGERTAKNATAGATKLYLAASVEQRFMNEPLDAFYNASGERGRIVYLTEGLIFDTAAFTKDAAITGEIVAGNVAHWDVATKKFIVHKGAHASYANAKVKVIILGTNTDLGKAAIRVEVQ